MPIRCISCTHESFVGDCDCCVNFEHCDQCKQPAEDGCQCCPCHGTYPCPGEETTYQASTPGGPTPWEQRGIKIPPNNKYPTWEAAWPTLAAMHKSIDVCMAAADFYLLDALRHGLLNRDHACSTPCHHFEFWKDDLADITSEADEAFGWLCRLLDRVFAEYVEMACGGELRHHGKVGGRVLSSHRRTAWAQWKWIHEHVGHEVLLDAADLFSQFPSGAFGGAKWGHAIRLLHSRVTNEISPITWVDQVFTLVHNGGVFLNKLSWDIKNGRGWPLDALQHKVLPAQQADSWRLLLQVGAPSTRKLWDRYWVVSNRARVAAAMHPTVNLRRLSHFRLICAGCGCHPQFGHTMACRYFLNGELPAPVTRVDEDQWADYAWMVWSRTDLPVGPNGEIVMRPDQGYLLYIELHTSYAVKRRRWHLTGSEMMRMTFKFARNLPKIEGWEDDENTEYWFVIVMCDPKDRVTLASFESRHTTNRKSFVQKYLTFGHIFPLVLTGVDWSHLVKEPI